MAQEEPVVEVPQLVNLVSTNSPYAFFKGVELPSDPVDAWQKPGFDESQWFSDLFTPFSYGESHDFGTILEDMQGNYTTFLLRHPFTLVAPETITSLVVHAAIDDGFIAWINGHEILRVNVAEQAFGIDYTASTVPEPVPTLRYDIEIGEEVLLFGENILAVQVVNGNIASSDIYFEISVDGVLGVRDVIPPLAALEPEKVPEIETIFGFGSSWQFFRGTSEPSLAEGEWRSVSFDDSGWENGVSPFFYGETVTGGTVLDDMFERYTSVYLRRSFEVQEHQLNRGIEVSALIDDGLAVWVNGHELGRAAVARGELAFDAEATIGATEPLEPTILRGAPHLLKPGVNWIAVQALNGSPLSSDFFVDLKLGVVDAPVIPNGATWRMFPGTRDPNEGTVEAWYDVGFDDRSWTLENAPFVSVRSASGGSVVPGMLGQAGSVFLRKSFFIDHPNSVNELRLGIRFAHGLSVRLNGDEIFRENVPSGVLGRESLALRAVDSPVERTVSVPLSAEQLRRGENVLAVQAINAGLDHVDFTFDLSLNVDGLDAVTPALVSIDPPRGAVSGLEAVTLTFSEAVLGIEAADLQVNGVPARDVIREALSFTFVVDQPVEWPARVVFSPLGPLLDLAARPNSFPHPQIEWVYERKDVEGPQLVDVLPQPGSTLVGFAELELAFDEPVQGMSADRIVANGQAAQSVVEISEGRFRAVFGSVSSPEVVIEWLDPQRLTDALGNPLEAVESWHYTVEEEDQKTLVINEIVSANATGLLDEDGEYGDWIEIRNEGDREVNLLGWSLTDDPSQPRKWVFPDRVVGPNQIMVVFASGKDRRDVAAENLHTNFKIGRRGDVIALFRPDLPLKAASVSPEPLPSLRDGVSLGRDASGAWRLYPNPSPGRDNGESKIREVVKPVEFNVRPGVFEAPFSLGLSADDSKTVIRYTVDGSEPTLDHGIVYDGPIRIAQTTVVRAGAFREGALPSDIRTASYLFADETRLGDLSIFSLSTADRHLYGPTGILGIGGGEYIPRGSDFVWSALEPGDYHNPSKKGREWERPVSVEYFDPAGDGFQLDAGVRVHGSVFARPKLTPESKFGFRLYFRDAYDGRALDFPVIRESDAGSMDRIVLRSGHNDFENPFISDEMIRRLSSNMGRLTSRGAFSHVFLNGGYQGYYNHVERIEISSLQEWFGGSNDWDIIKPFAVLSEGDKDEWDEMIEFFSSSDLALPANYLEAGRHLDLAAFVDYLLVNIYGDTGDWVRSNWRAVREETPTGKFRFLVWDAEFALGIYRRPVDRNSLTLPGELGIPTFITMIFDQLKRNEEFRLLFADRVQMHFFDGGALTDAAILATYERTRDEVVSVIPDFRTHIEDTWIPGRRQFMLEDLAEAGLMSSVTAPSMNRHGGTVHAGFGLTFGRAEGSEVYWTVNGEDPRQAFRGIPSSTAIRYEGDPIVLTESVEVKARAFLGGEWSALVGARFTIGASDSGISITELHYHPAEADDAEFLELTNRSGDNVNLAGAEFSGIEFEFPVGSQIGPGEVWVLVRGSDRASFVSLYPDVPIQGVYSGKLSNGGESIRLVSGLGNFLAGVHYDDGDGWPEAPDGEGPSLELRRLLGDSNDPTQWRASSQPGGTPGRFVLSDDSGVQLSELFVASVPEETDDAFVEILNRSDASVSIGGWLLRSLESDADLFRIHDGVVLESGARILVRFGGDEDAAVGRPLEGRLHEVEDTLVLLDSNDQLVDSLRYGDQVSGSSMIRTEVGAWTLGIPSPGSDNQERALASSDGFVINEWQSNPDPGEDDWFEIYNPDQSKPGALNGLTFSDGDNLATLRSWVFVPAGGFVRLWADRGRGPDHLPFRLSSGGGLIEIIGRDSAVIDSVSYGAQAEGEVLARVPDGGDEVIAFFNGGSPGETNVQSFLGDLVISEILWINQDGILGPHGGHSSFIEVANRGDQTQSLTGLTLRLESVGSDRWIFPENETLAPGDRAVVWVDREIPDAEGEFFSFATEVEFALEGGRVQLESSQGEVLDAIQFGHQVANVSFGRVGDKWGLLESPTPGRGESQRRGVGDARSLRINEWLASSDEVGDWIELFNTSDEVVELSGLMLTDEPGVVGKRETPIPSYHYIGPRSWALLGSRRNFPAGAQWRLGFSLSREGEFIRLYDRDGSLIDGIDFFEQVSEQSEGRIPDGESPVLLGLSPSPGSENRKPEVMDRDQDGLPDAWEIAHGLDPDDPADALLDADGDGIDNLAEYLAGSNPNDEPEILIGSIRVADEGVVIRYSVQGGRSYRLDFTDDLSGLAWQVLSEVETEDDQEVVEFVDPVGLGAEARFYRLVRP